MSRRAVHPLDAALCAVAGYGLAAVPLAILGWFEPWLVLPLATVVVVGLMRLAGRPASSPVGGSRSNRTWAVVAAALVGTATLWHAANAGDHVLNDRDPGVYITTAAWLDRHGDLTVESTPGPFADAALTARAGSETPIVTGDGPALHDDGGGHFHIQFQHLWPAVLALGGWAIGDTAYSVVPALVAGLALVTLYALAARAVRPILAVVAIAAIGLSIPFAAIARDAYSEGLTLVFIAGALWMLVTALAGRSARRAGLAGVLMGCAVMTRIDAPVYLVGWTVVLAVATIRRHADPDERWWRARGLPAVVAGTAGASAVAAADSLLRSRFYLVDHVDSVWPVLAALAVVSLASVLVVRLWARDAGLFRWWVRWRATLAGAAAAAGAVATSLVAVRPAFGADRLGDSTFAYRQSVAAFQHRNGLAIDPTRTYAELTGHWLAWYLGWPLLALAGAGLVLALWAIVRDHARLAVEAAVLVGLPMLAATLFEPSVTPDQPWAIRRFVPFSIPLVVLLAVVALDAMLDWSRRAESGRIRVAASVIGVVSAVLVVGGPARATRPVRTFSPYHGERQAVLALCRSAGDDAAVVVIPGPQVGDDLAQPIRALCGLPAANATGILTPEEVKRLDEAWAADGRRLVVAAERETQLALAAATPFARVDLTGSRELERTLDRRPSKLTTNRQAVWLAFPD